MCPLPKSHIWKLLHVILTGHHCKPQTCETSENIKSKKIHCFSNWIMCLSRTNWKCVGGSRRPCLCVCCYFCHIRLYVTLWTVAHEAPLSMGFSWQEYWSGLPYPPPGDCSGLGIKPASFMSLASSGWFFTTSTTWEAPCKFIGFKYCMVFCNIKLAWNLWKQNTFLWKWKSLSQMQLFVTPGTVAHEALLSMRFSRKEYWSEFPFPSQGIFLTQGLILGLLNCSLKPSEPPGKPTSFYQHPNMEEVTVFGWILQIIIIIIIIIILQEKPLGVK